MVEVIRDMWGRCIKCGGYDCYPECQITRLTAALAAMEARALAAEATVQRVRVIVDGLRFTGPPDTPKTATHHVLDGLYRDLSSALDGGDVPGRDGPKQPEVPP